MRESRAAGNLLHFSTNAPVEFRLGGFIRELSVERVAKEISVSLVVKDLIEAGVHFGSRARRWNPKMKPYIYGKRNLIHIIDLKETVRGLLRAGKYFNRVASNNGLILFVGTKRQATDTIMEQATRCGMPYVTERWLGGTLTNFVTIRSRLKRLEELERILDGEQASSYSKKMISQLTRERNKIDRNLSGIRMMERRPEALLVVDPVREKIAVQEARKLGIKVIALLDTDCDPDMVDLPIPGNDDSMRSIELVIKYLADAILEGRAIAPQVAPSSESDGDDRDSDRGRGRGDRRDRDRGPRQGGGGGIRRVGGPAAVAEAPAAPEAPAEVPVEPPVAEAPAETPADIPSESSAALPSESTEA
jgi:small subunit ribosomal protein S2